MLVSRKSIERLSPGMNPLAALNESPGVSFQTSDGQGMNTWETQLFMHGFSQSDIGITLDGMPLGEMGFRLYNGVTPSLAVASENVAGIDVSQSAGAEDIASTNNLGGSLSYRTVDPSRKYGGNIVQGFGSFANFHTFVRLDSGELNNTGTRFYVSYMRNDQKKWIGTGNDFSQNASAKLIQPVGQNSNLSAYFNFYSLNEFAYQDISPEIYEKLGRTVDYYYNKHPSGYIAAVNAANGIFPAGYSNLSDPLEASYYDGTASHQGYIGYIKSDIALSDRMKWTTVAYGHSHTSDLGWTTPYFASPTGSPLSETVKKPAIQRFGILSNVSYDIARNHIAAGAWYENSGYTSPMYTYALPAVANGQVLGTLQNPTAPFSNPFATIFNQFYNTNTFTAFVQDTYHPIHNLSVHLGFKSILTTQRVGNGYLNQDYYGSNVGSIASGVGLTTAKAFLPHINADWHFLPGHDLFIDISQNARTYQESGFKLSASPFSVTQAAYNQSIGTIKPETDWTYAIGYRYDSKIFDASVYAYRTNFFNRLQQITTGSVINPVSSVGNVGSVTMNGLDAQIVLHPIRNLSFSNNISYNHGVYDNNINQQGIIYRTKNQQVVNYPRFMYKTALSYDWRMLSFYVDASYTGARNYDYQGQIRVPGYWLSNLGIQWHVKKLNERSGNLPEFIKGLTVSFNLNNIANQPYIATMGENGNPLDRASGYSYQSMILSMPRSAFGSIRAEF